MKNVSFADIGRFIEENINSETFDNDGFQSLLNKISIKDAIDSWLQSLKTNATRIKYERIINRIIAKNLLLPDQQLPNLGVSKGVYHVIEEDTELTSQEKTIYKSVYASFCSYVRERTLGAVSAELTLSEELDFDAAKTVLKSVNVGKFIQEIQPPFNILAEMIFLAAQRMGVRLRVSCYGKNVLSLSDEDVDIERGVIFFKKEHLYGVCSHAVNFPQSFIKKLKTHLMQRERKGLVFQSTKKTILFPRQVERRFAEASEKLKLSVPVTPKMLGYMGIENLLEERRKRRR